MLDWPAENLLLSSCIESSHPVNGNPKPIGKKRCERITGWVNGAILLALTGLVTAVYLTPLKEWLADGRFIKGRLALFGFAAPLAFTMGCALLTVVGAPRLLLCTLGGLAFGFAGGLIWTQLGTVLGSYVVFLIVRCYGRGDALHRFARLREFSQQLEMRGVTAVVLIRQLPLNGFYNNVLLGLTPVSHGDFILGSLMGFLPLGIPACLLGAGLIQKDLFHGVQYVALGLVVSTMLGFLLKRLVKKLSLRNGL